jgi:hypothetical protein
MNLKLAFTLFAALLLFGNFSKSSFAGGVVNEPTEAALKAAIDGGGVVTFSFDGVIEIDSTILFTADTTIDATGHDITLDGLGNVRLMAIWPGVSVTLKEMNIFKGTDHAAPTANSPAPDALGGAILNDGGNLTVVGCLFFGNQAQGFTPTDPGLPPANQENSRAYGGAIYSEGGSVQISNSAFVGNRAIGGSSSVPSFFDGQGGYGGAIAMHGGTLTIQSCLFESNEARGGSPSDVGGAGGSAAAGALLTWETTAQISASAFQYNFSANGLNSRFGLPATAGAIWNGGDMVLNDSVVLSNNCTSIHADAYGGAICNVGSLAINRTSISGNFAQGGESTVLSSGISNGYTAFAGGVYSDSFLNIVNSTFLHNLAQGGNALGFDAGPAVGFNSGPNTSGSAFGGGLFVSNGHLQIESATFALNKVTPGSIIFSFQTLGTGKGDDLFTQPIDVMAHNSIFGSASSGSVFGLVIDGGYNLVADNSAGFTQPTSMNNTDPQFGVPTATYIPLTAQSPAIDSADPFNFQTLDQLFHTRPAGAGPDRGAIEFQMQK